MAKVFELSCKKLFSNRDRILCSCLGCAYVAMLYVRDGIYCADRSHFLLLVQADQRAKSKIDAVAFEDRIIRFGEKYQKDYFNTQADAHFRFCTLDETEVSFGRKILCFYSELQVYGHEKC